MLTIPIEESKHNWLTTKNHLLDNQNRWTLKKVYFPLGAEDFTHLIDDEHVDNFT